MIIKVLWTWCPNCKKLEFNTIQAIAQLWLKAQIEKVTDIQDILSYWVMSTPCLVYEDEILLQWKVASVEEIKSLLINLKND